ncbi:cobalt-precorrin 5A hydrolase [Heliophilum fasciatum]|uniref:Cobalt-precorrin 5A acetaldehyde-lyase n=1 Tax=Heliophilum fasciatum TaxID=35700 RepID=A0A4R2RKX0_9FIRM|nr:cobalamin biosynthesis protein [Heliophilum fasciatum]MCW2278533.1 cobalt-precorrin 5A hydrolase [Heliophilum fasciatum]TCP63488.1 cobalt-precorrin 5A acetaldehyde-lyase [Heliophilum fasciatum]
MNIVAVTAGGAQLARRLGALWPEATLWLPAAVIDAMEQADGVKQTDGTEQTWAPSLRATLARLFCAGKPLFFIGALGILVRMIAPLIQDKRHDPPVLVLDEAGQHVISVLSGHWGRANEITRQVATAIGAVPVITTATDVAGLPAVDTFARRVEAVIAPWSAVKQIASAMLRGEQGTWYAERRWLPALTTNASSAMEPFPWQPLDAAAPETTPPSSTPPSTWSVVLSAKAVPQATLMLYPQYLIAGVGCRRGVTVEQVDQALRHACALVGADSRCLRGLSTGWVKADEEALLAWAGQHELPVTICEAAQIGAMIKEHPEIPKSSFVERTIGVSALCEPAALLAHPQAQLILNKTIVGPVTVALAQVPWPLLVSDPVTANT